MFTKKSRLFGAIFIVSVLLLLVLTVALFGVASSATPAFAAKTLTLYWSNSYIQELDVSVGDSLSSTYKDENGDSVNSATLKYTDSNWVKLLLSNNNGTSPLMHVGVAFACTYPGESATMDYTLYLKKTNINNNSAVKTGRDGLGLIPVYAKNDTVAHTKPYATLESWKISGKDYKNTNYSNQDIYGISNAGVYKALDVNGSTLSFKFYFDYNSIGEEGPAADGVSTDYYTLAAGTIDDSTGSAKEYQKMDVNLPLVLQSSVEFTNAMGDYYNDNLGLSAQARLFDGTTNFRDKILLHSTTNPSGSFVYSTRLTSYQVSNSDIRRFKPFNGALGIGSLAEQTGENIESGATASSTNLAGLSEHLKLVWEEVEETEQGDNYNKIEDSEPIKDAGKYRINIGSVYNYIVDASPICFYYNNKAYFQFFTIEQRKLYVDLDGENGDAIAYHASKQYDQTKNAANLFYNVAFAQSVWAEMNGLAADYLYLKTYIDDSNLFVFEGSCFEDATIGKNKTVYLCIAFCSPNGGDTQALKTVNNYSIIPRISGEPCQKETVDGQTMYDLGNTFEIEPSGLVVSLRKMLDGDAEPFNEITYGDYLRIREFDFLPNYVSISNVTEEEDGLHVAAQSKWKIVVTVADTGDFVSDSVNNRLFIVVKLGRKIPIDDDESTVCYTDSSGDRYTDHNINIYAGDMFQYFFYYNFYVAYSGSDKLTQLPTADCHGSVDVPESSDIGATVVLSFQVSDLLPLIVEQKKIRFTVNPVTDKDYDGTDVIAFADPQNKFSTSPGYGLLSTDAANYVKLDMDARYAHAGADESVSILYDFSIQKKNEDVGDDIFTFVRNSYLLETSELDYDSTLHPHGIDTGVIRRLDLEVSFYETEYERQYNTLTYVAILAKQGDTPAEDLYFYYLKNEEADASQTEGGYGFATEAEIRAMSAFVDGSLLIKLKVGGFLAGEGFAYAGSGVSDFMLNKLSDDPDSYYSDPIDSFGLLSWMDTLRSIAVNKLAPSSDTTYRLEFYVNTSADPGDYDRYRYVSNYRFVPKANDYGYLTVLKLDVNPADIVINEPDDLVYSGLSNAKTLFDSGAIDLSRLRELSEIEAIWGATPQTALTVTGFVSSDQGNPSISQSLIDDFIVAGTYTVTLTLPATTNYNAFVTDPFEIIVKRKLVFVYITYAWCVYGDDLPVFDHYAYINDISDHTVKAKDGEIVSDSDPYGNIVYAYNKTLGAYNYVLYQGFVNGETIGNEQTEANATVSIEYSGTKPTAGIHVGAVQASGARKSNYDFQYVSANLEVKRRPLELYVTETEQTKNYTGDQITPDYSIVNNEPGKLAMYVVNLNGEPVTNEHGQEDETRTEVIEAGVYIVKAYAMPDETQGGSFDNYDVSEEKILITITVLPTKLVVLDDMLTATSAYTGLPYELGPFNNYVKGVSDDEPPQDISAQYEWGTVEIVSFVKNGGERIYDPTKIVGSGTYVLRVTATIVNTNNVYFLSGSEHVMTMSFDITLTMQKSSGISFVVQPVDNQGITLRSENVAEHTRTYYKIYDGQEALFGYDLAAEGLFGGELNVVTTVDNTLFAVNHNVYYVDDPVYNATRAGAISMTIGGISYDITGRNKMINTDEYTVTFYVNNESSEGYNENFISLVYVCTFLIEQAPLYVFIDFDEGYGPYKVYRTPNADVEEHSHMRYVGWIEGEDEDPDVLSGLIAPTIDWSGVAEDAYVNGSYNIRAQGGEAPSNYYFNYSGSELEFVIRRAESWIRVYGFYDVDEGVYTDYTYYNGLSLEKEIRTNGVEGAKVKVMRMSGNEPIDTNVEVIGSDGISINFVGYFVGSDKNNISEIDIRLKDSGEECKNVGKYVFAISVVASDNYNAVPEQYYYLEIVKADLTVSFVKLNDQGEVAIDSGYASKVYDRTTQYPTFNVVYDGFLGDDANVYEYANVFEVKHINEFDQHDADIPGLGLYHPYYEIFQRSDAIEPYDVGPYNARLVYSDTDGYGVSTNYNVITSYVIREDVIVYPVLEITRRPVDVLPGEVVIKTYDSNTRIPDGIITSSNYLFTPCYDGEGDARYPVDNTGPVAGDVIDIRFSYTLSRFERKDVFDEHDEQSLVPIRIYGYTITNNNYELAISELYNDFDGTYFLLYGQITPATAEIHFADEFGNGVTTRIEVTYNAEAHPIVVDIRGVMQDNGRTEDVAYTVNYDCDDINYHRVDPPVNAQTYIITVAVVSKNYVNNYYTLELVINKAMVEISFGGDIVQTYGSVLGGLSAIAKGVGNYEQRLTVRYYDKNEEEVVSIVTANADTYFARAVHEESANFLYAVADETFTILRREMYPQLNVYSSYDYTGKPVEIDVSFSFNGISYTPNLLFASVASDGGRTPYNYGDNAVSAQYPVNVGYYSVCPADDMQNFKMVFDNWINFRIAPVALTVSPADLILTVSTTEYGTIYKATDGSERSTVNPTLVLKGAVSGENERKVFVTSPSIRFTDSTGNVIATPTEAGIYVMTPYGGRSDNYVVTYDYGVLQLNKPSVAQSGSDEETPAIVVEGSFSADVTLVARVATDIQYNRVMTAYEVYKLANEEFKEYNVYSVYDLRLSDGNVKQTDGGMMIVRLFMKDFFKAMDRVAYADDEPGETTEQKYFVARLSADGSVTMIEAERDGDYLVFTTDRLETFAVLSTTVSSGSAKSYDWLLYVGIAVGVVMIGIALLIVKMRA